MDFLADIPAINQLELAYQMLKGIKKINRRLHFDIPRNDPRRMELIGVRIELRRIYRQACANIGITAIRPTQ